MGRKKEGAEWQVANFFLDILSIRVWKKYCGDVQQDVRNSSIFVFHNFVFYTKTSDSHS